MRRALPLLLLALVACKGSRDKDLIGTWTGPGSKTILASDKRFTSITGPMNIDGTWSMDGDDATLKPMTINGKPVAQVKVMMEKLLGRLSGTQREKVENFVKDIDVPTILTLSGDGRTMNTNKAKDKNLGPPITLTKI